MTEQTPTLSLVLIVILTLVLFVTPTITVTSNSTPRLCTPSNMTRLLDKKSSSLYSYTVYTNIVHPEQNISMHFYVLNFLPVIAGSYRFLPRDARSASAHWRQRRRGCRGHIPTNILVGGDVNGNTPPPNISTYFRTQETNISRPPLKPISFGYKMPPIRFSLAGGQWVH